MSTEAALSLEPASVSDVYKTNDEAENIKRYSQFGIVGTSSLAFRDVPALFKRYSPGKGGIDFGCGSGRSTRFLGAHGLNPTGVDISPKMLDLAKELDSEHDYQLIESGKIPVADKTCDFVFSSFVFLVLKKDEMVMVLADMRRVLKDDGVVIISTGSENIHSSKMDWVSYDTDFPENQELSSGSLAKLGIKDVGTVFLDYNWLDSDYQPVFEESGFEVVQKLNPLGKDSDGIQWKSEKEHSPAVIYVLKKIRDEEEKAS